jgi:hypothetical protein
MREAGEGEPDGGAAADGGAAVDPDGSGEILEEQELPDDPEVIEVSEEEDDETPRSRREREKREVALRLQGAVEDAIESIEDGGVPDKRQAGLGTTDKERRDGTHGGERQDLTLTTFRFPNVILISDAIERVISRIKNRLRRQQGERTSMFTTLKLSVFGSVTITVSRSETGNMWVEIEFFDQDGASRREYVKSVMKKLGYKRQSGKVTTSNKASVVLQDIFIQLSAEQRSMALAFLPPEPDELLKSDTNEPSDVDDNGGDGGSDGADDAESDSDGVEEESQLSRSRSDGSTTTSKSDDFEGDPSYKP